MTGRAPVLAWGLWTLFVLVAAATLALVIFDNASVDEGVVVLLLGFATVGALVATRERRNAVGWLLLTIALSFSITAFTDAYVLQPGRPAEAALAWLGSWVWFVWMAVAALLLPLVFPSGRLLSPRWRFAVWTATAGLVLSVLGAALQVGPLEVDSPAPIENPLGVGGAVGEVLAAAHIAGNVLFAVSCALGGACLVLRLRGSRGRERQQLKLFAYAGAMAATGLLLAMVEVFVGDSPPQWVLVVGAIGWFTALGSIFLGLPIAVGIAILRHRLYGIDVVINRTLVYGTLTATLVTTYLGSVLLFRLVLSPLTGDSDLAVAASTLAVAALFRPARSRIQAVVDRRFFRERYDAARTLETFTGRLRDELDLEALGGDLRRVVADTMQPAHVSLWLRGAP